MPIAVMVAPVYMKRRPSRAQDGGGADRPEPRTGVGENKRPPSWGPKVEVKPKCLAPSCWVIRPPKSNRPESGIGAQMGVAAIGVSAN